MKSLPANPRLGSLNPFPAAKKKAWNFNSSRLFVVRAKNRFSLRFPVGMNFWAGMDGQVYVRGNIYATNGVFNGIVKATDFQLPSGDSMVSILNDGKKIKSDWLDLMGINVKDENGNTVMTIDGTNGITIQKGSIQWSSISGRPSIPSIPSYITRTKITETTIESPTIVGGVIRGGKFEADADGGVNFVTSDGSTTWGSIIYNGNGINIGAIDGIVLDPGWGNVVIKDRGQVVDTKYLQEHPIHAVFA